MINCSSALYSSSVWSDRWVCSIISPPDENASIKGTTSCELMMCGCMWHLCNIYLLYSNLPANHTQRPLCLPAVWGVLWWTGREFCPTEQRQCKTITLYSTVWFLIFLPIELGADQSVTEPSVSWGRKLISAVNPFVLLPRCLNAALQTGCMSLMSGAESVPSSEVILCREKEEETEEAGTYDGRDYSEFIIQKQRKSLAWRKFPKERGWGAVWFRSDSVGSGLDQLEFIDKIRFLRFSHLKIMLVL